MARLPGIDMAFAVLQAQTEALVALPETVRALTSAVRSLAEVAASAREAVQATQRLAVRMDALVADLEEPVRALGPGLSRLARVLDDPVVEEIPQTLTRLQEDLLPVLRTLADTHERVAFIAGQTDRIVSFVDDTGRALAGLPGAALLGRRRVQQAKPVTPAQAERAD